MNNVYVRGNTSIKSISLTRLFLLLPLIIYGCYKNGVYLYTSNYINLFDMFRPINFNRSFNWGFSKLNL